MLVDSIPLTRYFQKLVVVYPIHQVGIICSLASLPFSVSIRKLKVKSNVPEFKSF